MKTTMEIIKTFINPTIAISVLLSLYDQANFFDSDRPLETDIEIDRHRKKIMNYIERKKEET